MRIGERIAEQRKKEGMSGKELADRLGVTPAMVYRIESGSKQPPLVLLAQTAKELNIELSELARDVEI